MNVEMKEEGNRSIWDVRSSQKEGKLSQLISIDYVVLHSMEEINKVLWNGIKSEIRKK